MIETDLNFGYCFEQEYSPSYTQIDTLDMIGLSYCVGLRGTLVFFTFKYMYS